MTQPLPTVYAIVRNNPFPSITVRQKGRKDDVQRVSVPVPDEPGNRQAIARAVAHNLPLALGLAQGGLISKAPRIAVLFVHEGGLSEKAVA